MTFLVERSIIKSNVMMPVCPKCDQPLFLLTFQGTELDFCHDCRGLWLDAGELENIIADAGGEGTEQLARFWSRTGLVSADREYLCPRCDRPMEQVTTADGLALERCQHGIWLDEHELEQLASLCETENTAGKVAAKIREFFTPPTSATNNQGG